VKALPAHAGKTKVALKKLGRDGLETLLAEAHLLSPASSDGASTEGAGTEP
jgi:hypothetical protein